ncbi:MAG TPA: energy transducer TonB [Gammaproteobacteria bacterium]|nr:energy transducer TonB [Gammaproteobacteria bacterium]
MNAVQSGDRLAVMLFLAAAFHALIILGIGFAPSKHKPVSDLPVLDITVVQQAPTKTPKDPDYLANVSQDGNGNVHKKVPAQPKTVAHTPPPAAAPPKPPTPTPVVTTTHSPQQMADKAPPPKPAPPAHQPTASELISKSMELVQLDQQVNQPLQAYAKHKRQTYISARTRAYKYASYMSAWVHKVERVGNLNYPDKARREQLSGSLLLDVALNPDGTIRNITLRRSSGHKLLDDAAIRIVRLAAPFAPFPPDIRKNTDVLHIVRTWEFMDNNQMSSR